MEKKNWKISDGFYNNDEYILKKQNRLPDVLLKVFRYQFVNNL